MRTRRRSPSNGRIVFVVDGYTTSANYPYAERVDLGGGASVNYARSSVRATVDAFSGQVRPVRDRRVRPDRTCMGPGVPDALPPRGGDARAASRSASISGRPLRGAGDRLRAVPYHPTGRVRERFRCLVAADEPLRLGRRRRGHPVRRGRRGQPPASRAARVQVLVSARTAGDRGSSSRSTTARAADRTSSRPSTVGSTTRGRARLASRILPPDRITLGPAQISRLVFSTPRVSNLLGLTNLELRDLDKSSIDTVSLGKPHLVFLPRGIVQIQSLYKGANGPGVSRIIGATAFLNGRAGVGSDVDDAVRQALHKPPRVDGPASPRTARRRDAGRAPLPREERATRGHDDHVAGRSPDTRTLARGGLGDRRLGAVRSRPRSRAGEGQGPGRKHGRRQRGRSDVLSPPPTVRLTRGPTRAVVGRPVRFSFRLRTRSSEVARSRPGSGTFTRRYRIRNGTGFIEWTPRTAGPAVLRIRARGRQGQTAVDTARMTVARGPRAAAPTVTLLQVPDSRDGRGADPRSPSRSPDLVWPSLGSPATAGRFASGDSRVPPAGWPSPGRRLGPAPISSRSARRGATARRRRRDPR